jgi:hypothetical protein
LTGFGKVIVIFPVPAGQGVAGKFEPDPPANGEELVELAPPCVCTVLKRQAEDVGDVARVPTAVLAGQVPVE